MAAQPTRPTGGAPPRRRFLWAFLAAISSFVVGGCVSIGLAVRELTIGGEVDQFLVAWIVLDHRLRSELPEVGEVFIDVTAYRRR